MGDMKTKLKKDVWKSGVFWGIAVVWMLLIFYMSAQPAENSDKMSGGILLWIEQTLGIKGTSFIIRKLAHLFEFAFLAFCLNAAFFYARQQRPAYLWALCLTSLYGASDEFHQLFVPGRACQLRDWLIDTSGAAAGTLVFFLLLFLWRKIFLKWKQGGNCG